MPRENQDFSKYFYTSLIISETEIEGDSQNSDDADVAIFSMFAQIGVEPIELFDLKLARQTGRFFEDSHESMIEIDF